MQIEFTNTEVTMLILSTDTLVNKFERAYQVSDNHVEAQRAQRRLESTKALQQKLLRSL